MKMMRRREGGEGSWSCRLLMGMLLVRIGAGGEAMAVVVLVVDDLLLGFSNAFLVVSWVVDEGDVAEWL
jgi:hypothetical protein